MSRDTCCSLQFNAAASSRMVSITTGAGTVGTTWDFTTDTSWAHPS